MFLTIQIIRFMVKHGYSKSELFDLSEHAIDSIYKVFNDDNKLDRAFKTAEMMD